MTVTLNSSNRCSHCNGVVQNAAGRRRTIEQLAEIHEDSCPGLLRSRRQSG